MNINSRKRQALTRPPADSHLTYSNVTGSQARPRESGNRAGLTPAHSHDPLAGSAGTQHSDNPSQNHGWHPVLLARDRQRGVSGYCAAAAKEGYGPPAQPRSHPPSNHQPIGAAMSLLLARHLSPHSNHLPPPISHQQPPPRHPAPHLSPAEYPWQGRRVQWECQHPGIHREVGLKVSFR